METNCLYKMANNVLSQEINIKNWAYYYYYYYYYYHYCYHY